MRRIRTAILIALLSAISVPVQASCWDWSKVFGTINSQLGNHQNNNGGKTGSTIGNLLEGVFSRTDISVKDMSGTWVVDGSAVAFKSEDFLSQAGGVAAGAALETELDPYYRQYGLTGAILTIDTAGNCVIKLQRGSLKGIITRQGKGEFLFSITVFGQRLSSVPLYVRKTSQSMDMMFDVAKLKQILSIVANFSGNQLAKTMISLLEKYEGIYVGFGMHRQGTTPSSGQSGNGVREETEQNSGLGTLRDILTGRKKPNKK